MEVRGTRDEVWIKKISTVLSAAIIILFFSNWFTYVGVGRSGLFGFWKNVAELGVHLNILRVEIFAIGFIAVTLSFAVGVISIILNLIDLFKNAFGNDFESINGSESTFKATIACCILALGGVILINIGVYDYDITTLSFSVIDLTAVPYAVMALAAVKKYL